MNRYIQTYYLLFVLLIMGAFAAMAQNAYGLMILGFTALTFAGIFLWRGIGLLRKKGKPNLPALLEMLCLAVIAILLSQRIFYIRISYAELLLTVAGITLISVYTGKLIRFFKETYSQHKLYAIAGLLFYLSLILFLASLVIISFSQKTGEFLGITAFIILFLVLIFSLVSPKVIINGNKTSALAMMFSFKDHSILINSIFFFIALYFGLNRLQVLPGLYSDEYPQPYFRMVQEAEAGKVKPVNGVYPYQHFKDQYELFLLNSTVESE